MAKLRKSISKRFKITRSGKIMRRPTGQDHNLAKKSAKKRRQMKKWIQVSAAETRAIKKILTY